MNLNSLYKEFLGKDEEHAQTGRSLFLANSGLKPALDLENHGLFAQVLLDGLKGKADSEGYEADGNVTVGELVKYVRKEFRDRALTIGKNQDEKGQRPIIFDLHNTTTQPLTFITPPLT